MSGLMALTQDVINPSHPKSISRSEPLHPAPRRAAQGGSYNQGPERGCAARTGQWEDAPRAGGTQSRRHAGSQV